jgi:hypothetical protein
MEALQWIPQLRAKRPRIRSLCQRTRRFLCIPTKSDIESERMQLLSEWSDVNSRIMTGDLTSVSGARPQALKNRRPIDS